MTTATPAPITAKIANFECPHLDAAHSFYVLVDDLHSPKTATCIDCTQEIIALVHAAQGKPDPQERPRSIEIHTAAALVEMMRGRDPIRCNMEAMPEDLEDDPDDPRCSHTYSVALRPDENQLARLVTEAQNHMAEHTGSRRPDYWE